MNEWKKDGSAAPRYIHTTPSRNWRETRRGVKQAANLRTVNINPPDGRVDVDRMVKRPAECTLMSYWMTFRRNLESGFTTKLLLRRKEV
jgi:hypothetical protein